jgi:SAM-dependent methyltransferase
VSDELDGFAGKAERWSETAYVAPDAYLAHRAMHVASLGVALAAGDEVLDLACADGGLGQHLVARGFAYRGVDAEPAMVEAARRRLGEGAVVEVGKLDAYVPPAPVAATTVFRAIYYAKDRQAFFARVRTFTQRKLVFDLNPRRYPVDRVVAELEAEGFARVALRPFLVPQTKRVPIAALGLVGVLERTPAARVALGLRFTYLVAAVVE